MQEQAGILSSVATVAAHEAWVPPLLPTTAGLDLTCGGRDSLGSAMPWIGESATAVHFSFLFDEMRWDGLPILSCFNSIA